MSQAVERIRRVAVTNYTGYVIEADVLTTLPDYNRDRIRTELILESDNSGAGTARNYTNVLTIRLLDSGGNPHPLILPGGATNNSLLLSNVINAPAGSIIQTTNGLPLQLAAQLNPYSPYRVQLNLSSPFAPPGTTSNGVALTYKHFTNVINNDASLNIISEAMEPIWTRATAVATDNSRKAFLADVPFTLYRFDGFSNSPPATNVVGVRLSYELRGVNSNTVIPLVVSQEVVFAAVPSYQGAAPREPAIVAITNPVALLPAPGVQLDAVNEQYRLRVSISHTNDPGGPIAPGNMAASTAATLFHFTGRLMFGAVETRFTELGDDPQMMPVVGMPSQYPAILYIINQSGTIVGAPGHTFGNGERIGVYLQADGTSIFTSNNIVTVPPFFPNVRSVAVNGPVLDVGVINGTRYARSGVALDNTGGHADVAAILPSGFGYTKDLSGSRRFQGTAIFSNATLVAALEPSGPLTLPGPMFASCDSHPIVFAAGALVWTPQAGAFSLALAIAGHVAIGEFNSLNGNRPGNYNHYRWLSLSPTPLVTVGTSNGFARLYTDLEYDVTNATFKSHFPYGAKVSWTNGGELRIRDGVVAQTNGGSYLAGVEEVTVEYGRDCPGCGTTDSSTNAGIVPNGGQLLLTRDGGLIANGATENGALAWGFIAVSNDFANRTEVFPTASYHMPGHSLRGGDVSLPGDAGGAVLMLTGVDADNLNYIERPDRPSTSNLTAYQNGFADYAGINYAVVTNSGRFATSILAGVKVDHWPLSGRSKYYVRASGVTGIHEATDGGFPSDLELYGYQTTLSNYTLSFLDGVNLESKTIGSVVLPYPSGFTQDFSNLKFSCPGGLLSADIPSSSGDKRLQYWAADFTPKSFSFASPDECDPSEGYLVLGVQAWASQFVQPIGGSLGFKTDGRLINKNFADSVGLEDIDSRLKMANNVGFAGPGSERYNFTPVANVYFNSYGTRPGSGEGSTLGWLNMAGTIDVPFFEDLKIHIQTAAQRNDFLSPLYLMGGWPRTDGPPNYGWRDGSNYDFFTASYFDPENRGWPTGLSLLNDYRASTTETYHPRAQRLWVDLFELDYPLAWSSSARSFASFEPKEADFLILHAAHQVPYMSAERLELTFGVKYDGLPQINLENLALDLLDDGSDIARSVVDATTDAARDAIIDGLKDLDDILADLPEQFFDPLLDKLLDPTIAKLQQELGSAWSNSPAGTFNTAAQQLCDQYIRGTSGSISSNLASQLRKLSQLSTNVEGAVKDLNTRLLRVESMIETNRLIIAESPAGSGRRTVGSNLIHAIVGNTAPQFVVNVQGAILDEMLVVADPTFDAVDESLGVFKESVVTTREDLTAAGGLGREMNDAITAGQAQIDTAASNACSSITAWLADIEPDFAFYTPEEIQAEIRRQIEDAFYGQQLTADLQTILRAWFHEVDSAVQEAIDSAFAQFNRTMRDLISQSLAEVDDTINPLIGDVNAVLGAGRVNGYAHFNGDSLDEARIDVRWRWNIPEEAKFDGYALIRELNSKGDNTCAAIAGTVTDVTIGALDVPVEWIAPDIRVDVAGRFSFTTNGILIGLGGSFETTGEFHLEESFTVTDLSATAYFGATENYLGASAGMEFNGYSAGGGLFFGHACTLDPIKIVDPDIGSLLKDGEFTGAYGFARVNIPITEVALGIPCSCLFCISASMGAGAGYRAEGHEFIAKIEAGISGDALCLVNVYGDITLAGSISESGVRFNGTGEVGGCIGHEPLEVCHDFSVTLSLENGKWGVDHREK